MRISSGQELASTPIPFTAKTVNDPTLLVGTKKVTQVGQPGTMVATYQDGYVDGMRTTKSLIGQQVTVQPIPQITAIGTKPKPIPPKPKPKPAAVFKVAADGLNWKALAACEAGGRANADNPPYYGMYQFRLNTWRAVGGTGLPSASLCKRADVSRATALQAQQLEDPMAGLRPPPLHLSAPGSQPVTPAVLLGATDIRALAASIDLTPTKTLGQNFVIDGGTVQRIVRTANLRPDDVVLEIGPGLGSLTLALLPDVQRVIAVEIDERLAKLLPETVAQRFPGGLDRLTVIHRDAMSLDLRGNDFPTAIVANLPYNVAVPVLLTLLARLPTVRRVLVMVQLEVAARLAAKPGEDAYGVPSVKAAWYGSARMAGTIGRQVFWPAPRVDSGLVAIDRHDPPQTSAHPRAGVRGDRCRLRPAPQDPAGRVGRMGRIAGVGGNCLKGSGN